VTRLGVELPNVLISVMMTAAVAPGEEHGRAT
jgi:hypothetical protein